MVPVVPVAFREKIKSEKPPAPPALGDKLRGCRDLSAGAPHRHFTGTTGTCSCADIGFLLSGKRVIGGPASVDDAQRADAHHGFQGVLNALRSVASAEVV